MASARERVSGNDGMTEYERKKWAQVARNNKKMESLRLMQLSKEVQSVQQNKRSKVKKNILSLKIIGMQAIISYRRAGIGWQLPDVLRQYGSLQMCCGGTVDLKFFQAIWDKFQHQLFDRADVLSILHI